MVKGHLDISNPLVTKEDLQDHTGVGALIYNNEGKVLFFHHVKYNFWTLPIGKCSIWDNPFVAIQKELNEELGISVPYDFLNGIGSFTKIYDRGNNIVTTIDQILFEVTNYSGDVMNREPHKHDIMEWLDLNYLDKDHVSDMTLFARLLKR